MEIVNVEALKGRNKLRAVRIVTPLQGSLCEFADRTQGVALGFRIAPLWGWVIYLMNDVPW